MKPPLLSPRRAGLVSVVLLAAALSGCNTPTSYRVRPDAATTMAGFKVVVVDPLDAELSELSTGGVAERRDDWTKQAADNIAAAIATERGWSVPATVATEHADAVRGESEEVQALLRAITLNQIMRGFSGFPVRADAPLTYNTGALAQHTAALGSDAVLFVFVRNSYATAGRKGLMAFSFVAAAFTGVAIVPMMGSDLNSAALVARDGTVLWFNSSIGGADPRTPEGARELTKQLLAGLPKSAAPLATPAPAAPQT